MARPKKVDVAKETKSQSEAIETSKTEDVKETKSTEKTVDISVNIKSEPKKREKRIPTRSRRYAVIVKGKERMMSKASYLAVVKDSSLKVTLPEGSELSEYNAKPCKDC